MFLCNLLLLLLAALLKRKVFIPSWSFEKKLLDLSLVALLKRKTSSKQSFLICPDILYEAESRTMVWFYQ